MGASRQDEREEKAGKTPEPEGGAAVRIAPLGGRPNHRDPSGWAGSRDFSIGSKPVRRIDFSASLSVALFSRAWRARTSESVFAWGRRPAMEQKMPAGN